MRNPVAHSGRGSVQQALYGATLQPGASRMDAGFRLRRFEAENSPNPSARWRIWRPRSAWREKQFIGRCRTGRMERSNAKTVVWGSDLLSHW